MEYDAGKIMKLGVMAKEKQNGTVGDGNQKSIIARQCDRKLIKTQLI